MTALQLFELARQHGLQALAAHIMARDAVQFVADRHVVCRDGFRDGAGSPADVKEPSGGLLARADFGEGPELLQVDIDLQGFLGSAESVLFHSREC